MNAAHRRLREELGMEADLSFVFTFQYRAAFDNGLTEHELDHVFIGYSGSKPVPNPAEVADYRWLNQQDIERDILAYPETYSVWFKMVYQRVFGLL